MSESIRERAKLGTGEINRVILEAYKRQCEEEGLDPDNTEAIAPDGNVDYNVYPNYPEFLDSALTFYNLSIAQAQQDNDFSIIIEEIEKVENPLDKADTPPLLNAVDSAFKNGFDQAKQAIISKLEEG